mmetsp:Transcript_12447/g.25830  ORF Transcript_12447/g.25830 Transcript_12447/m.25830 type:complete len:239 (+) Transcript_12447:124-840(+)
MGGQLRHPTSVPLVAEQLEDLGRPEEPKALGGREEWVDVLKEVVDVAHCDAHEVVLYVPTHEQRDPGEHPWKVGSSDGEEEHLHPSGGVPPPPNVGHDVNNGSIDEVRVPAEVGQEEQHGRPADEHPEEVGRPAVERHILERGAVEDQDIGVPKEREAKRPEEEEACHEPPQLQLVDDELPVEVQREGREHIQGAEQHQRYRGQDEASRHGRLVPQDGVHGPGLVTLASRMEQFPPRR